MKLRGVALTFILALALLAAPLPSDGQQPAKVYRIGFLMGGPATSVSPTQARNREALVEGLRERGYIEGQNLVIERRYTEGQDERAASLAAELVSLKPDLIIVQGTAQVRAVKQLTSTIPIVMVDVIEPVRRGLVASLAHPGGNVTGLADIPIEMEGKRLQLLKEAVPKASRVAVLRYPPSDPNPRGIFRSEVEAAARALDVTLEFYTVGNPEEFAGAFAAIKKARAQALFVQPSLLFWNNADRIVALAAQSRLPAVYPFRAAVEAGPLACVEIAAQFGAHAG